MLQNSHNEEKKTITIIDTFGFLFRSYFALPPLKSKTGFPTGLLTGFMNFIFNIGKDFQTDYLVFALDSPGDTFRNEIYDGYKAHRQEVPQDLLSQLPIAIEWIEKMGFKTASKTGFEADDIIASIAHDAVQKGLIVRIVSHDKDLYQLIDDDRVFLFDPIKKDIVNEDKCIEKYGIKPIQFIDYQALIGDSADNIPGVKGVGAKTAQALLQEFHDLDNIYNNLDNIAKPRWVKLLEESKDMAYISKELVTLKKDSHVIQTLQECELPVLNPILKIQNSLLQYDLNRIVQKVKEQGMSFKTQDVEIEETTLEAIKQKSETSRSAFEAILVKDDKMLMDIVNEIPKEAFVAFDTETDSLDAKNANIIGFSFCFDDKKAYYVPLSHTYLGVIEQVSKTAASYALKILNQRKLVLQNFKYDYLVIKNNFNVELKLYADTMILSWLLNTQEKVGLDYLANKYFNHTMIAFKDVVKKGETFANVDVANACEYAAEDAYMTYKLYFALIEALKAQESTHLIDIAHEVEFEFIYVLAYMQEHGIKIDTSFLQTLKEKTSNELKAITQEIFKLSQCEFNINSTKQLGVVLFEQLQLPTFKKTKTGYSTNESVLQKLYDKHEIVPKILEYREAYKLQSTYIEPLLELAKNDKHHKIYTSFLQTGTATGRLSSKNPNLQNIPVRTSMGRQIRDAFIADEHKVLIGIDYSQIELRLLAHFSQDEALMNAFQQGLDIHLQTAVKIFGEEASKEKRDVAKTINFGLLYGMGSKKLSETLGITTAEAKGYIESYFKAFPTVKSYLKSIEEFALEHGYVQTLLKRQRMFDFNSVGGMQKAMFLREAVNTMFQGSAADLIKLAMIKIYNEFKTSNDVSMLLQIHDELIFEVNENRVETISERLKQIMENIYTLRVPLSVSVKSAKRWGELK
jgi:DNA polymerase-1